MNITGITILICINYYFLEFMAKIIKKNKIYKLEFNIYYDI